MKLIGGREVFFSETFILPEGESASFDASAKGCPLRVEVTAEKVPGGLRAQATTNVIPASGKDLQAGAGPLLCDPAGELEFEPPGDLRETGAVWAASRRHVAGLQPVGDRDLRTDDRKDHLAAIVCRGELLKWVLTTE